ncbi:MAG: metallophosphoesterase family protein [Candidatus Choladocola sp.]|nr:metallophosphoesterase family protein [Candidatus Choladocola sp.]
MEDDFSVLPVVLVTVTGIYHYFYFRRIAAFAGIHTDKTGAKGVIALVSLIVTASAADVWGVWIVVVSYHMALGLLTDFADIVLRRGGRNGAVWRSVYGSGVISVALTVLVLFFGYQNMHSLVRTEYEIHTDKNIRERGYRICLVSDLHYGRIVDAEELRADCERISEENPDLLILCGDIVDENTTKEQMKEVFRIFSGIGTEDGIYYVYGNHDRGMYASSPSFTEEQLLEELSACKITVLEDDAVEIRDELVLIGRNDLTDPGRKGRADTEILLGEVNRDKFLILVDHQPRELEKNMKLGCDLQLSGHTHGGQIWPTGEICELLGFGEMNYGHRQWGDSHVIVSSGMAGGEYPLRTGHHSEYVMIKVLPYMEQKQAGSYL